MIEARVRFFFDYVDPASYVVERWVREFEAEAGVALAIRHPFEVNPPPGPLLDPGSTTWRSRWAEGRARAAAEGMEVVVPRLVPWTRKAHELAWHARDKGLFAKVHQSLFRAFHESGEDIGRVDVLVELARELSLDVSEARAVLDVDKHADAVAASTAQARAWGITTVPTLALEDRHHEDPADRAAVREALAP
ncbi:MAG TPA: DsbA family protein [Longimicrobiales bacterium]|jgi:predicted DsbA family dithiol-disulfide isomerase